LEDERYDEMDCVDNDGGGDMGDVSCDLAATDRTNGDGALMEGPYSLEYLASIEQRETAKRPSRPQFGPEPPQPSPVPSFDLTSLEGMMKQITEELGAAGLNNSESHFSAMPDLGDAAFQDMFQKIISAESMTGIDPSDTDGSETPRSKGHPQHYQNSIGCNDSPPPPPPRAASVKGDISSSPTTPRKSNKKEPNVDESINRLLDGINKATSNPIPNDVDPGQFEKIGGEMFSSIEKQFEKEFEKMGNANDSNDVMDGVMKQLLDKDLMYEPMREVCLRFPRWLADNKDGLTAEEYQRHGTQYQYFQRIVHVYETEPDNFSRLMELMQDIQEYGQPPADIIRELAPELQFDAEGVPMMNPTEMGGVPGMMPGGMAMPGFANEQCPIS